MLAISDVRAQRLDEIESVVDAVAPDLILYAGDDVARFGPGPNSWSPMARRVRHGLAGVIGNDCSADARAALRQPGCHDLHEEPLLIGELAFLGLQGAPDDRGRGLGYTLYAEGAARHHLDRQLSAVGKRPVILVSHAPPRGILDLAVRFGLEHIGTTALLEATKWPSLKAVICGHVHLQGGRQVQHGSCLVVNCASHDEGGAPLRYAVLTWDGHGVVASTHVHDERGHLGEIRGMQHRHARDLKRAGAATVGGVHDLGIAGLRPIVGGFAPRYWFLAKAQVERRPVLRAAPMPIARDALFVDVETSFDDSDVWMVAFKSSRGDIEQFHELERRKQRKLLTALDRRMRSIGPSQLLQWSAFDRSALEKAYGRYWQSLPSWLNRELWVDAMWWTDRAFALPFRSRTIKDVAAYFGYEYVERQLDGLTVGSWYQSFLNEQTHFDVSRVLTYNRDDVEALRRVVESILTLAKAEGPATANPWVDAPKPKSATASKRRALSRREKELVVAKAIAGFETSMMRQFGFGRLNRRHVRAAVSRYAEAMRREYGLPPKAAGHSARPSAARRRGRVRTRACPRESA